MNRIQISRNVYMPIVKTLITLFILWVIGAILKMLPMLKELALPKVSFTVPDIINMIVASLMAVVLVNFAKEIGFQLKRSVSSLPESGVLVASLVYAIAVVIVYDAFTPLGYFLFDESFWVYQVGFFILLLVPVSFGGVILYRNADNFIDLVSGGVGEKLKAPDEVICQECNAANVSKAKFCVNCGAEIILPKEEPTSAICQECGAENDLAAKFCLQCGSKITPPVIETASKKLCPACRKENEPDAGFCIECGARLS
ncbi:MAG: zinc ribbon domain-containing protein [Anaerolineales bacterium]|nr:zinc ribbon domain-containing protein [Chloroflexota bacterium]MBL6981998.1 zinc ribbon domain-containing protein [Anaerolineales bacterium]